MNQTDYERIRAQVAELGDPGLAAVLQAFDSVFRTARSRPREDLDEPAVLRDVLGSFPTPFVAKLDAWLTDADPALTGLLKQMSGIEPNQTQRERIASRFRNAFLAIDACWLMLVGFLPLLFMALLGRIEQETLQRHAEDGKIATELGKALFYFNRFYSRLPEDTPGDQTRQREADQRSLLARLLRLFRQLSRRGVLGNEFPFARIGGGFAAEFSTLFPERFESLMLLQQQIRNKVVHHQLEDRLAWSPEATSSVYALIRRCFVDVLALLLPVTRQFGLCYVTDLSVRADYVEARVLDFSGEGGPQPAQYRVGTQPQPEGFAFVQFHLYLLNREKQETHGKHRLLDPADYVDLTPFLVAGEIRRTASRRSLAPEQRERLLFVLRQYLESVQRLRFTAFGAGADLQRPQGPADSEATEWVGLIDRIRARARQITVQVRFAEEGDALSVGLVRSQLWATSRQHLAGLLDVRRYDEHARPIDAGEDLAPHCVYDRDLFVEPAESAIIDQFLGSQKRALLLVGDSGLGKSNLLLHHYLRHVQTAHLAAFLSARRFDAPSFRTALQNKLVSQISNSWQSLDRLDRWLDDKGEMLLIIVDAVNEYSGPLGPLGLLGDIIGTLQTELMLRRCKLIVSCRTETWLRYSKFESTDRPLDRSVFFGDGLPVQITTFDELPRRRELYHRYRAKYRLAPVTFDRLSPSVQELVSRPFMMSLLAQAYANPPREHSQPKHHIPGN